MSAKGGYVVINRVYKYSNVAMWSFWMWMQLFYEYSFSTAVIGAGTQHSTRTDFRSPIEHLLVGENRTIWCNSRIATSQYTTANHNRV